MFLDRGRDESRIFGLFQERNDAIASCIFGMSKNALIWILFHKCLMLIFGLQKLREQTEADECSSAQSLGRVSKLGNRSRAWELGAMKSSKADADMDRVSEGQKRHFAVAIRREKRTTYEQPYISSFCYF